MIAEYHEYLQRRYQARMARYYAALEQIKENGKRIAEEKRKANERVLQWKDGVDFVSTINNINKLAKLTENEK